MIVILNFGLLDIFSLVLVGQLTLNDAEEFVCELQENWVGAFLKIHVEDVCLFSQCALGSIAATDGFATAILVHGSRWSSLAVVLLQVWAVLYNLVDVQVKLEELLPYKVFNELVIVHEFFIINFCSAFELQFL